jgi:hypothetical protein
MVTAPTIQKNPMLSPPNMKIVFRSPQLAFKIKEKEMMIMMKVKT